MLQALNDIIAQSKSPGAVASLNIVDFDMVRALLAAAEELHSPVIIAVATRHWEAIGAPFLVPSLVKLCRDAAVPVALHLDHASGSQMDIIRTAIEAGFTSIMIDGSKEEYAENVRITSDVVAMARGRGVSVEGELGAVGGIEGVADYADADDTPGELYTDPERARDFAASTGIDALAVAVGTAHGLYRAEPKVRLDLIEEIAAACPVPLVLHGATGLPEETIRAAVVRGIRKINYFSGFMVRAMDVVRGRSGSDSNDYLALRTDLAAAWRDEAKAQIELYRG